MPSIKFDSVEIVNSTYVPRQLKHESVPFRELALQQLAKDDGAVLVSERYGVKYIVINGSINASTQAGLETAIDTFKELFSRKAKNLDISWAGNTRRYVATCSRHEFNRDYMHINLVPWVAEFVVPSGMGKDVSLTAALNAVSVNATPYNSIVTLSGSAEPKPIITLTVGAGFASTCLGISFENTDKDEKLIVNISTGYSNTDILIINCEEKTVKLNAIDVAFHGVFPTFIIGSNNFKIETGRIIDQQYIDANHNSSYDVFDTYYAAQSYVVPEKDETYQSIALYINKYGTPPNALVVEIQTDSNGEPSGSAVTNATFSIPEASVGSSLAWVIAESANPFTLSANTKYWIVISTTGGAAPPTGARYIWRGVHPDGIALYKRGNGATSLDSGSNWTDEPSEDSLFKLMYGGKLDATPDLTLDVDYFKKFL